MMCKYFIHVHINYCVGRMCEHKGDIYKLANEYALLVRETIIHTVQLLLN